MFQIAWSVHPDPKSGREYRQWYFLILSPPSVPREGVPAVREHAGRRQNRCTDDTDKDIFFKRLIMKQFLHFLSPLFHQIPVNCRYLYDLTDILRVSVNSSLFKHTLLRLQFSLRLNRNKWCTETAKKTPFRAAQLGIFRKKQRKHLAEYIMAELFKDTLSQTAAVFNGP